MGARALNSANLRAVAANVSGEPMPDKARLAEIDEEIAAVRANLLELIEQAAAYSGGADEELAAERIARQERMLASLQKQREEASK
jgi:hypothetical protein